MVRMHSHQKALNGQMVIMMDTVIIQQVQILMAALLQLEIQPLTGSDARIRMATVIQILIQDGQHPTVQIRAPLHQEPLTKTAMDVWIRTEMDIQTPIRVGPFQTALTPSFPTVHNGLIPMVMDSVITHLPLRTETIAPMMLEPHHKTAMDVRIRMATDIPTLIHYGRPQTVLIPSFQTLRNGQIVMVTDTGTIQQEQIQMPVLPLQVLRPTQEVWVVLTRMETGMLTLTTHSPRKQRNGQTAITMALVTR
jgi:hypothetical protein